MLLWQLQDRTSVASIIRIGLIPIEVYLSLEITLWLLGE